MRALMDSNGPAHVYSGGWEIIIVTLDPTVLCSDWWSLVGGREAKCVRAGAGNCETIETGRAITCCQRTEDGVIIVAVIPEESSLEGTATFVGPHAERAGAA